MEGTRGEVGRLENDSGSEARRQKGSSRSPRSFAIVVVIIAMFLAPSGSAQEAPLQQGGDLSAVATAGDHTYVGQGATVVTLTSDGSEPAHIADVTAPLPGLVSGLAIHDDVLFATWRTATPSGQLALFSLADPANPTWLANVPYTTNSLHRPGGLAIVGTTLYLVDSEVGLIPIDISDPENPVVGTPLSTFGLDSVAAYDSNHLVAWGRTFLGTLRLVVFDVSTPDSPTEVGSYGGGNQFDVVLGDGLAVLTGNGIQVVDLTDPTNPSQLASEPSAQGFTGTMVGSHLLLGWEGAIRVWDLSDPSTPTEKPSVPAPADRTRLIASSNVPGETLMITDMARAIVVDTSVADAPTVEHVFDLPVGTDSVGVAAEGSTVYISDFYSGLRTTDTALGSLGRLDFPSGRAFEDVAVGGSLAIVADWGFGLRTVDVSSPDSPVELGNVPFDFATAVDFAGDRAWAVSSTNGGFFVEVDISDPSQPAITSSTPISKGTDVHVDGNHVYVADESGFDTGGLRIFDVTAPAPVEVAHYTACDSAGGVDVEAGIAALGCRNGELHLIDVSVPAQPVQIGVYSDTPTSGSATLIEGERVYFGSSTGLDVVDISDPTAPSLIERHELPGGVRGITAAVDGGAWVAAATGGVALFGSPVSEEITLEADGRRVRGVHAADLTWTGTGAAEVDIVRDGEVVATVPNDGSHTDETGGRGRATYTYQVCVADTSTCSNEATVRFGGPPS